MKKKMIPNNLFKADAIVEFKDGRIIRKPIKGEFNGHIKFLGMAYEPYTVFKMLEEFKNELEELNFIQFDNKLIATSEIKEVRLENIKSYYRYNPKVPKDLRYNITEDGSNYDMKFI